MKKPLLLALAIATASSVPLHSASAALVAVDDNVLSDGVMEYLTMGEVGALTSSALEAKLSGPVAGREGWRLGTRQEFYDMVRRNLTKPLADYEFNDLFVDGMLLSGASAAAWLDHPGLDLLRSGDPDLAIELRDMILLFEGQNADPAFLLFSLGTAETDGADRRFTTGIGAYYNSDNGTSISRNNTIRGPGSTLTRAFAVEVINQRWFVVRTVPEPVSAVLVLVGGLFVAGVRQRVRV